MRAIYLMMMLLACMSVYAQNIEFLNPDEQRIHDTLEGLQWGDGLSKDQIEYVTNALCSTKDAIVEIALNVAILHDLPGLKDMLERKVGPSNGYGGILAATVGCGLEEGQSAIESLRRISLKRQAPQDARTEETEVREKAKHIIAIYIASALRRGEVPEFEWDVLEFNSYERRLLQYSMRPSADVTREITRELARASVAGVDEYDLVRVLDSYEKVDVDDVLQTIQNESTEVYGKVLLLAFIEMRVWKMTAEERRKVESALGIYETKDNRIERALKRVTKQLENGPIP